MDTSAPYVTEIAGNGIATITLRRPDVHNAFDDDMIKRLTLELMGLGRDPVVRVVVLAAEGKTFCAGADLNWMKRSAGFSYEENLGDAHALATLMKTLYEIRKPTVAAVQGNAFGGGVGLMAACDIVVAAESAKFALSEVKLGIIPAAISPFVFAAMGPRQARRYMLSAEVMDAQTARDLGLVHEVVPDGAAFDRASEFASLMLKNGPCALAEVKNLARYVAGHPVDETLVAQTSGHIARVRYSDEGQEGITAFLEKRKPNWIKT